VKEFLSRAGVAFTAKNVDEDEQAYDELIARGFRTIPVTIVGDKTVKGFDPDALTLVLADRARD
jgi:glutaredoxin-like protein NrdH